MGNKENVRAILEAISDVKGRAQAAKDSGDMPQFNQLMGDLVALEACLIGPVTAFLEEVEKNKKAA